MVQQRARRLPADKRRRQIIETARGVFAAQSYAKVSTADLAKAAGISEPGLYRHFTGKKDLFVATIRATGPRLLQIWEEIAVDYEDPLETLWAIGVYYYDHLESHSANMKLQFRAISEADDPEIRDVLRENFEAFVQFVADTLEEGKSRGIVRRDDHRADPRVRRCEQPDGVRVRDRQAHVALVGCVHRVVHRALGAQCSVGASARRRNA